MGGLFVVTCTMYVHLHTHSYYSLLEGLSSPTALAMRAKEIGSPAAALTDRASMYGAVEFYKACKEQDIAPVIGTEVYVAATSRFDMTQATGTKKNNLILIAYNHEGYKNLLHITTKAHTEGFYYKPRVDKDLLREHASGLLCLSSNIGGEIPQAILAGKPEEEILAMIQEYQGIFGSENMFLELEHHPDIEDQHRVNTRLIELGRSHNVPLVVTNNVHYAREEDKEAHEIILCLQTGKDYNDPSRFTMRHGDYSMRDWEKMKEPFGNTVDDAFQNTIEIANRCHYDFTFGKNLIPSFEIPKEEVTYTKEELYFRKLCWQGLLRRYELPFTEEHLPVLIAKHGNAVLEKELTKTTPEELKEFAEKSYSEEKKTLLSTLSPEEKIIVDRLEYEMCAINEMGFCTYFLITQDFVQWAKDQDIAVGPGRGSAAGSMVAYVLSITDLDPLRYSLLFERFLNPARVSMPDIDMDFEDARRMEVLDYVTERYGRLNVAQVATFGTMKAKQAVKDVGRALGIPYQEMDMAAKKITEKLGTKLKDIIAHNVEVKELMKEEKFEKVFNLALRIEGVVRQVGVHACAVIISEKPLLEYTALQYPPKDKKYMLCQYSMKPLEALGLLKMDFLGLRNLTILQIALKIIQRVHNIKVDISKLPLDDQKTFALFSRGETKGVFQFESEGMRKWLKELKPDNIEDIIAMASMYRPGPLAWIPVYVAKKHGLKMQFPDEEAKQNFTSLEKLLKKYPEIKEILDTTNMIPIYQEQILQIAQRFSGFSLGEADLLRRAIGKKIMTELLAQKEKFIEGAKNLGRDPDDAKFLFERGIEPFADYGFNKSHAACYALIAYQTAYLKAHYPTEFMTALLSTVEDNTEKLIIQLEDATSMGIKILQPDINESLVHFTTISEGIIRFGLNAIKGLGTEIAKGIIKEREAQGAYTSLEDFLTRVPLNIINRKTLEALIYGGAFDLFDFPRNQLATSIDVLISYAKEHKAQKESGQTSIFGLIEEESETQSLYLTSVEPMGKLEKLKLERQFLGFYVTGHPLEGLEKYISQGATLIRNLNEKHTQKPRTFVGLITHIKKLMTKNKDLMASIKLEDTSGEIGAVLFPKTYETCAAHLIEDQLVKVIAKYDLRNGEGQLLIQEMVPLNLAVMVEKAQKEALFDATSVRNSSEAISTPVAKKQAVEKELETYCIQMQKADAELLQKVKEMISNWNPGNTEITLSFLGKEIKTPYKVQGNQSFITSVDSLLKTYSSESISS